MSTDQTLVKLTKAEQALALAETPQEAAQIARIAAAAAKYYKQSGAEIPKINDCVRLKLRAERKAGEKLAQIKPASDKGGGDTRALVQHHANSARCTWSELDIPQTIGLRMKRLAAKPEDEWNEWLASWPEDDELHSEDAYRFAAGKPHVSRNSGENEWYTPSDYIEAARTAMGVIDLDPASSELAQRTVKANRFFSEEDDALQQDWVAKTIWLNPPYAQPLIANFVLKLCSELAERKTIEAACLLVNNSTDTTWFQAAAKRAVGFCFPEGRLRFIDKNGNPSGAPLQGQAVLYFGSNLTAFVSAFNRFGLILNRNY